MHLDGLGCIFVICSVISGTAVHSLLSFVLTGCCRDGWMIPAMPTPTEPGKLALISVKKIADNRRNFTFKATCENPLDVNVVINYCYVP